MIAPSSKANRLLAEYRDTLLGLAAARDDATAHWRNLNAHSMAHLKLRLYIARLESQVDAEDERNKVEGKI